MTAKAGSSWRSKGKSSRNRVLKRAVMVSAGKAEEQRQAGVVSRAPPEPSPGTRIPQVPTFIPVPDCQDPEDEGTEGGSKEAPPVVPHGEEGGGDLDAEQDTCERPGRAAPEAWPWPRGSEPEEKGKGAAAEGRAAGLAAYLRWAPRSSSPLPRHRRPPASPCSGIRSGERGGKRPQRGSAAHPSPPASSGRPYLIDTPEEGEELAEQGGTHARDMNERALGDGSGRE